ncbi:N-acetylglucosamine-6-phosphate deacetylase [Schumannella sp. 10F1B-5-1]|uniref:N-acetylglucosamine-6-phosphate deacetylase n=1 Tax=Schumannella sp. 10F1B-5-1 TaxID=2590780 RepID=UPI0011303749|nr:N-acetylglucosamine-6-phosphate deacetylase [Schumannella sp. 10F1B-5-1]TPW72782.1 N-acetylglucosamine-6-phosphate deacetylase [Schumannella sp. 10F1B-5-1]
MSILLHSARRVDARGEVDDAWLLLEGERITSTARGASTAPYADESIDLDGARMLPGFVDIHGHGGGAAAYDAGGEELERALAAHRPHGTTRQVVSLVANPLDELEGSLAGIAELSRRDPRVLGSHLEGPFLSPAHKGAHNPDFLIAPEPAAVDRLLAAADGTLRQITIAPELPGALDAIARFADAGVAVAVGHTDADADLVREAFARGARLLTHAFNAMRPIHHRAPGPVVAALDDERVVLELILDGTHVHPSVARMLFASAPGRVALVTDAMAAAASADGDYRLGSLDVEVRGGVARIAGTDTIAGSTLTQDTALRLAVHELGLSLVDAATALSLTPARALGLDARYGLLAAGHAADVVVLDDDDRVARVWAAGAEVNAS